MPCVHDPETETLERLKIGGLQIVQPRHGYRFSLDAVLLADFMTVKPTDRLIDLGTGTGIIPLLTSALQPARAIVGLELQERLAVLARRNVQLNALEEWITIVQGDLKRVNDLFHAGEFDVLCSNPPYRRLGSGRLNPVSEQAVARHEIACELEALLAACCYLLKSGGKAFFIYLAERLSEFLCGLRGHQLEAKTLRCIHSSVDAPATLVLLEAQKQARPGVTILPPLVLYRRENVYSEEAKRILHEDS
ncbi:methyltransferase [candidate division KSB3 bacterium]|uniref:Methyltransferase n=1 Tax=candidate division KSB3 bacterium TaxID=2044937 RepID=A0A9D5JZ14_9BACT|nr:methyltransferase [candidate division KSB3 bacterium]MBD3326586.1 methyltransferase [candidate division KSB3 bacterium]